MTDVARPAADPDREEFAQTLFPMDMTPEEYAALYSHTILSFTFDQYSYSDKKLDIWIQQLGVILGNPAQLKEYRRKFLSAAERAEIEAELGSN